MILPSFSAPLLSAFFDWDGTLVDSLGLLADAHNHVRIHLGLPVWNKSEYFGAVTMSARELYPKLYADRAQEAQDVLYSFVKAHHLSYLKAMPGAVDLLESLSDHNIQMGVVSNKRNDILQKEVEHLGWEKYFGVCNGAGVAEKDKPSGIPLSYALNSHPAGIARDGFLYIGDTETDFLTCCDAQCSMIYIQHEGPRPDLVEKYKPYASFFNLMELKDFLINQTTASQQKKA